MLWWVLSVVVAVALIVWLIWLSRRAPRRAVDAAPAPMQTPGVLTPGPLTTDVDYEEQER